MDKDQARQAPLAVAGVGFYLGAMKSHLKGWKLKKLCCISEHLKVTGRTRWTMGETGSVLRNNRTS